MTAVGGMHMGIFLGALLEFEIQHAHAIVLEQDFSIPVPALQMAFFLCSRSV
jgi:hypothetical protein